MAHKVTPFLMFEGNAEAAMTLYVTIFRGAVVRSLERHGAGESGEAGKVRLAMIELAGQEIMCCDSAVRHAFTFTPSTSLFVECEDEQEFDRIFAGLASAGTTLMPVGDYGFSRKFGWVNDRYGVSWQLTLR